MKIFNKKSLLISISLAGVFLISQFFNARPAIANTFDQNILNQMNSAFAGLISSASQDCSPDNVAQLQKNTSATTVMCSCSLTTANTTVDPPSGEQTFKFNICKNDLTAGSKSGVEGKFVMYKGGYGIVSVSSACNLDVSPGYSIYFSSANNVNSCAHFELSNKCCCATETGSATTNRTDCAALDGKCPIGKQQVNAPTSGNCADLNGRQGTEKIAPGNVSPGISTKQLLNDAASINQLTNFTGSGTAQDAVRAFIGQGIIVLLSFIGSIALVLYIFAGLMYMTGGGNTERLSKAKLIFVWTTLGVFAMLGSYVLVQLVFKVITQGPS